MPDWRPRDSAKASGATLNGEWRHCLIYSFDVWAWVELNYRPHAYEATEGV